MVEDPPRMLWCNEHIRSVDCVDGWLSWIFKSTKKSRFLKLHSFIFWGITSFFFIFVISFLSIKSRFSSKYLFLNPLFFLRGKLGSKISYPTSSLTILTRSWSHKENKGNIETALAALAGKVCQIRPCFDLTHFPQIPNCQSTSMSWNKFLCIFGIHNIWSIIHFKKRIFLGVNKIKN